MNNHILMASYNKLLSQRNRLLIATGMLGVLCGLLGASNFYLIGKERIIIAPPIIHREFWISTDAVSDHYLEQMSQFFAGLLLNVSPSTFAVNAEHLLAHVVPERFSSLKTQLVQQQMELERRGMSTSFHINRFKIDRKKLLVELQGELKILVANTPVESSTKIYSLKFVQQQGRLWIQSFEEVPHV
ncbi:MAG: type IV conjugative transfer system protein TraE [Gammaproteobacteria bacterium]|nr:type IV conjugative transfer system protein TraE [Gammaproteobacteria bacterium]